MPATRSRTGETTPLFAQSLESKSQQKLAEGRSATFSLILFGLPTILCAGLMLLARPDIAQTQPGGQKPADAKSAKSEAKADEPSVEPSANERRPLSFYTGEVRSNMFSAPQPPAPPAPKPVVVPKPKPIIVPPVTINPFADWSYTGTVHMGDQAMALIENTKTKEGQYLKLGESFMGAQVSEISDQMVTLKVAGKPTMLAKSDNTTVTPLDKSAPFLSAQPGQPQPGQPQPGQMPPGMPGGMPGGAPPWMNGGMRGRFGGANMDPAPRAQRRANRLNQQFNGQ